MRGSVRPPLRTTQAGISLVETLVALVLGLAMVSVAFNLYVSNRAVFRQIEAMVRLQESASIAAALLETNIRHAAGTLCRNNPPFTPLLNASSPFSYSQHTPSQPYAYWEDTGSKGLLGLHGYESDQTDPIVGSARKAGDSISIMSDNMGAVARVTGTATYYSSNYGRTGSYTFPVDNGTNFPAGTVAMACDYTRAVLFQVTESNASTITLQANAGGPSPGNCSVAMKVQVSSQTKVLGLAGGHHCTNPLDSFTRQAAMYTFGPGSMIGEHTFHHWYIGRKTDTTDGFSLYRRRMVYEGATIKLGDAEEMVQDVTNMQISYLQGLLDTGYPSKNWYIPAVFDLESGPVGFGLAYSPGSTYRSVTAVRIVLTLTSPQKVGLAANNAATAATYTIPINVAIRARMPGVVRR